MMKPVSDVDRILLAMRAQATTTAREVMQLKTPARSKETIGAVHHPVDELVAQIRSMDAQDPQRSRRIFRALLEGKAKVLFGVEAVGESTFKAMFEQVLRAMEQDVEISGGIERTVSLLERLAGAEGADGTALRATLNRILAVDAANSDR